MAKGNKNGEQLKKYELALKLAMNEGHTLWGFSQGFLIFHTIFAGFISSKIFSEGKYLPDSDLGLSLLSLMGLLISYLWLLSYFRRSKYYEFRIAQARKLEKDIKDFGLVKGIGEKFAEGKKVEIEGKAYCLGVIWRSFKDKNDLYALHFSFYLLLSGCNNFKKSMVSKESIYLVHTHIVAIILLPDNNRET